jgi:hypothetical protein
MKLSRPNPSFATFPFGAADMHAKSMKRMIIICLERRVVPQQTSCGDVALQQPQQEENVPSNSKDKRV